MKLFTAIPIDADKTLDFCAAQQDLLREHSVSGNYTHRDNLHLTLIYIGETEDIDAITTAMDEALMDTKDFVVELDHLGRFEKGAESLVWLGGESPRLTKVYDDLYRKLTLAGFELEKRPFKPHITLARRVLFSEDHIKDCKTFAHFMDNADFTSMGRMLFVNRVVLYASELVDNKRVYREIHSTPLG